MLYTYINSVHVLSVYSYCRTGLKFLEKKKTKTNLYEGKNDRLDSRGGNNDNYVMSRRKLPQESVDNRKQGERYTHPYIGSRVQPCRL